MEPRDSPLQFRRCNDKLRRKMARPKVTRAHVLACQVRDVGQEVGENPQWPSGFAHQRLAGEARISTGWSLTSR